jgi:branched-chain amino acid aminotransferase
MPSKLYAYVNGKFVPETEARVSIFDRGFLYGDGCFETMRLYAGKMFRLDKHLARLAAGLSRLGIPMPPGLESGEFVKQLFHELATSDGVARIYVTRDSVVATARPQQFVSRQIRAIVTGARVDRQLSRFKTANRLPYILAQREAEAAGSDDAVLLNAAGNVVELTTSNIFVVKDGEVFTPPLSDGPLPGITRSAVFELTTVSERSFTPEVLDAADEVFATNSLMEIAPVTTWSRQRAVTSRLQQSYRQLVQTELK